MRRGWLSRPSGRPCPCLELHEAPLERACEGDLAESGVDSGSLQFRNRRRDARSRGTDRYTSWGARPPMTPQSYQPKRILFVSPESYFTSGAGIGTYLHSAVRAHLAAGRKVHVLTWLTSRDAMMGRRIPPPALVPLTPDDVTVLHITDAEILRVNRVGVWDKNISDLLFPHIARLEAEFEPDIIEGTDHRFPLHTYLQQRLCG